MIGKPYSGKLNVRFDEGELEIEPLATTPALYSTLFVKYRSDVFAYQAASSLGEEALRPDLDSCTAYISKWLRNCSTVNVWPRRGKIFSSVYF